MRKKLIAGNWKMHFTPKQAVSFIATIKDSISTDKADVLLCVPFVDLCPVMDAVSGTPIQVGAQNMHFADSGAYTGEISALMLAEMGVPYVVIGHSERRKYYNETDETVNQKIMQALANGLIPIVCVGENEDERNAGVTNTLLDRQVRAAFEAVSADEARRIVVAYEPIWAIGTGNNATPEQAQEACAFVRQVLCTVYDDATAQATRILYGGSVNPCNAKALFTQPDIDGGLVGGASIVESFKEIVHFE